MFQSGEKSPLLFVLIGIGLLHSTHTWKIEEGFRTENKNQRSVRTNEQYNTNIDDLVSVAGIEDLNKALDSLHHHIGDQFSDLVLLLKQKYEDRINSLTVVSDIIESTTSDLAKLNDVRESIFHSDNANEFLLKLQEIIDLPEGLILSGEMLKKTEAIAGYKIRPVFVLVGILDKMIEEANAVKLWYQFLIDLYNSLLRYEVQAQRALYNVKDIKNWQKHDSEEGLTINEGNFGEFLQRVVQDFAGFLPEYKDLIRLEANEIRIKELNEVIEATLKSGLEFFVQDDKAFIFGRSFDLVSATTVIQSLSSVNTYIVMALDSLLVNDNITFHSDKVLSVFAGEWLSDHSQYVIDLKGSDGGFYSDGSNDTNGRPGLPGQNGGSFVGFGTRSYGLNLVIRSQGGNGGDGENGKRGVTGTDKVTQATTRSTCNFITNGTANRSDTFYFDPKACGGKGGDGGAPGKPGLAGEISMSIIRQDESTINTQLLDGKGGVPGKGGEPGFGGSNKYYISKYCNGSRCETQDRSTDYDTFPPGKPGVDGANTNGQLEPSESVQPNMAELLQFFSDYVETNINDKYRSKNYKSLMKFVESEQNKFSK